MNRIHIIQQIIDRIGAQNYLEMGVCGGSAFLPIKCARKIAVDPEFHLSRKLRFRWLFRNLSAEFHEVTSDEFFATVELTNGVDVVFVDGLHTYEQVLRDVENSLRVLNQGGVIVMHDCNPATAAIAHPASLNLPGWSGEWSGDVWKAICHLQSQRSDLRVFVLDCDYGLGIITRGNPDSKLAMKTEAIANLTYADLANNRQQLLNLKPTTYFPEFLKTLQRSNR